LDGDCLAAEFQPDIHDGGTIGFHGKPGGGERIEAGMRNHDIVRTEINGFEAIDTSRVGDCPSPHSGSNMH
jgi:hypothetical protein